MFLKVSFQRFIQAGLALAIALAVVAAALPQPAQAAADVVCAETITIKEGDTINKLSKKYGITVYRLAKANNLEKPYTLVVGQKFCIPESPKPSSNYKWSAVFKNGQVTISGEKFKKSHPFFIKVRDVNSFTWFKLGKVVTSKTGEMEKTYKIPKTLAKSTAIFVCLKDGVTDYLDCKRVFRQ